MIEIALSAQILIWLMVIGAFFASGQASIFHPATIYLAFHGLVFVLRPLAIRYFGFDANWDYMLFAPTEAVFRKTLAVSSFGLVVFVGTCVLAGRTELGFQRPGRSPSEVAQLRGLLPVTLLLLPLIAWSIYGTRHGIRGARVGGVYILTESTGYLTEAQNLLAPLLCAWLVKTGFHWLNALPIACYMSYRVWFGMSRWTIVLFVLMVVATYSWHRRLKWVPLWSMVVALPVLAIFTTLGHNRDFLKTLLEDGRVETVEYNAGMTSRDRIKSWLDTQDFSNFDFLSYVVAMVPERSQTYTYGMQYLQIFTEPVPRMLWKSKPVGSPVKLIDFGEYGNFNGLTLSLVGDAWMSGGWAGLFVVMGVAGWVLGRCHRLFWRTCHTPLLALLYTAGLAILPQYYRDGSPLSLAKFLLFAEAPILLWIAFNWLLGPRWAIAAESTVGRGVRVRLIRKHDPGVAVATFGKVFEVSDAPARISGNSPSVKA